MSFYKRLIALRKQKKIIREGSIRFIQKDNPNVLAYKRKLETEELAVFANVSSEPVALTEEGEWKNYRRLIGNYKEYEEPDGRTILLRPFEFLALERA